MRFHRFWFLIAALLLVCGVAGQRAVHAAPAADGPTAQQRTYYVATWGSDRNPGSASRPWRTIGKAASTLDPGQVVYIKNGVYRENVNLGSRNAGRPGRRIAYRAYPGHQPVLDGTTVGTAHKGLFELTRADHIEISGLTIRNSRVAGIHVRGSEDVIVRNNRIQRSTDSGIGVWRSSDVVVEGNVLEDCRIDPRGANEMLSVAAVTRFSVRYNEIYWTDRDCCGSTAGIDVKQESSEGWVVGNRLHDLPGTGIYVDGWEGGNHDHHVAGNFIHNVKTGISLGSERGWTLRNVRIYNTSIHHVLFCGIRMQTVGQDGRRENIHIYNNTIVGSFGHGGAGIMVATYNVRNIVLTNNLINFGPNTTSGQIKAYRPSAITSVSNLVYGPKRPTSDRNLVEVTQGTITADPRFLDAQHQNFHLRSGSPARDRGSRVDLDRDHDGVPRPHGSGYDIGAYEYRIVGPMNHKIFLPAVSQR
jgi:parallel beta-helix repeat protein